MNQLHVTSPTRSQVRINAGMLCNGKTISALRGSCQEDPDKASAGSRVVSWKGVQTLTEEATKPLDDRCQKGGHCLNAWTKKQQVSLSTGESELYAAVKTAEGLGIQSVAKGLGMT